MGSHCPGSSVSSHLCQEAAMISLLVLSVVSLSSAGYFHPGYHGYHHPLVKCERVVETVTKKLCRIEVEKECVTKTKTFKKITGYEDGECKEIEVCKHALPYHHGYLHKREAEADPHHPYYVECEKETKEVCKKEPVIEEVSKDFELCHPKPTKVCEDKEIKVPSVVCEEPESEEAAVKEV